MGSGHIRGALVGVLGTLALGNGGCKRSLELPGPEPSGGQFVSGMKARVAVTLSDAQRSWTTKGETSFRYPPLKESFTPDRKAVLAIGYGGGITPLPRELGGELSHWLAPSAGPRLLQGMKPGDVARYEVPIEALDAYCAEQLRKSAHAATPPALRCQVPNGQGRTLAPKERVQVELTLLAFCSPTYTVTRRLAVNTPSGWSDTIEESSCR